MKKVCTLENYVHIFAQPITTTMKSQINHTLMNSFLITKSFTKGVFVGMTIVDKSPVQFEVGAKVKSPMTSSEYVVINCIPVQSL